MSWIIYALLSAVSASLVAIFGKIGLKGVDSTLATAIRSIIMALFLVTVALSLGKVNEIHTIGGRTLLFIALSGIAGATSWLFYFFALKVGPVAGVVALDKLSVVLAIIIAAVFLGEALTWKTGLGAVFITLGALLMIWK